MDILERASLGLPTGLTIDELAAEEVGGIMCPLDPQELNECEACQ